MGERLSGGGFPGRRRAHPDGARSGPREVYDTAALETALATAIRGGDPDPGAEQRAVAAFRAARAAGGHRAARAARTRRRDDWRMPGERRAGRPVRVTLGVVLAAFTLGGAAVAAIGSAGSSAEGAAARETARPSAVAPDGVRGASGAGASGAGASGSTGAAPSASSRGSRQADRPARAQDTEAHCRAYEQVEDRGKALGAKAWQRLVLAAGGPDKVAAYCSRQLAGTTATAKGRSRKSASGNGGSGNGTSGKASGGTDDAGGNGRASGGQGGGKGNGKSSGKGSGRGNAGSNSK